MARARVILFIAANPDETARLNLEKEMREVKLAFELGVSRERFELRLEPAVNIHRLQHILDRHRPDIVHFCGHGSQARGEIILLDEHDHAYPVPIEPLASLLASRRGVVINTCSSAAQAAAIANRGPWAVGMTGEIDTDDAVAFARTFYSRVADGVSETNAFDGAKNQLALERRNSAGLPEFFPARSPSPETKVNACPDCERTCLEDENYCPDCGAIFKQR